jgi:hypothetical protein
MKPVDFIPCLPLKKLGIDAIIKPTTVRSNPAVLINIISQHSLDDIFQAIIDTAQNISESFPEHRYAIVSISWSDVRPTTIDLTQTLK